MAKNDARMHAIGEVDEANSAIGVAIAAIGPGPDADRLTVIQNELFDLGADLATPGEDFTPSEMVLRIVAAQVDRLEAEIDAMNADLDPLRSFILPRGHPRGGGAAPRPGHGAAGGTCDGLGGCADADQSAGACLCEPPVGPFVCFCAAREQSRGWRRSLDARRVRAEKVVANCSLCCSLPDRRESPMTSKTAPRTLDGPEAIWPHAMRRCAR